MTRSRSGFTLLEIMLAIAIGVLIISLAVPSVSGLMAEQKARRSFDAFEELVQMARQQAIRTRLPSRLLLEKKQIVLQAENGATDEAANEPGAVLPIEDEEEYAFQFPAALEPEPAAVWTFWPTGGCEPVVVSYAGPDAKWTAAYDALTTLPEYATEAL